MDLILTSILMKHDCPRTPDYTHKKSQPRAGLAFLIFA